MENLRRWIENRKYEPNRNFRTGKNRKFKMKNPLDEFHCRMKMREKPLNLKIDQ